MHRDVKPANVLVAEPGHAEHEHVYLTDFGIARGEGAAAGEMTVTRTGAFVGTLDYMAPEQMTGARGDARSDIYSFGCMLFQALAGRVPFPREQDVARIHAHVNEPFPSLLEHPRRHPAGNGRRRPARLRKESRRPLRQRRCARPRAGGRRRREGGAATVASEEARPTAETVVSPERRPRPPRPSRSVCRPHASPSPPPRLGGHRPRHRRRRRRSYVLPGLIGVAVVAVVVAVIVLSSGGGSSKDQAATGSTTATQASTQPRAWRRPLCARPGRSSRSRSRRTGSGATTRRPAG